MFSDGISSLFSGLSEMFVNNELKGLYFLYDHTEK